MTNQRSLDEQYICQSFCSHLSMPLSNASSLSPLAIASALVTLPSCSKMAQHTVTYKFTAMVPVDTKLKLYERESLTPSKSSNWTDERPAYRKPACNALMTLIVPWAPDKASTTVEYGGLGSSGCEMGPVGVGGGDGSELTIDVRPFREDVELRTTAIRKIRTVDQRSTVFYPNSGFDWERLQK